MDLDLARPLGRYGLVRRLSGIDKVNEWEVDVPDSIKESAEQDPRIEDLWLTAYTLVKLGLMTMGEVDITLARFGELVEKRIHKLKTLFANPRMLFELLAQGKYTRIDVSLLINWIIGSL